MLLLGNDYVHLDPRCIIDFEFCFKIYHGHCFILGLEQNFQK